MLYCLVYDLQMQDIGVSFSAVIHKLFSSLALFGDSVQMDETLSLCRILVVIELKHHSNSSVIFRYYPMNLMDFFPTWHE